jgi:D-alanyl-D-alanine carboxypeptidase
LRRVQALRRGPLVAGLVLAALALAGCSATAGHAGTPPKHIHSSTPRAVRPTPTSSPTPSVVGFDKAAQSTDDPASSWLVVNKSRALSPVGFVPGDLVYPDVTYVNRQPMRQQTADALVAMFNAGRAEAGLEFSVQSAYRSYDSQVRVYDDDVQRNGRAYADTDTARPGHSEHQTGLAVDISAVPAKCSLDACFAQTPQGMWLAANAYRFGFLLRYPSDKVAVTGFTFEPWHFRFVGVPLAAHLHEAAVTTLEEFFAVPGGTEYAG